ncbi:hypothetical protein BEI60_00075 [Eisenbergiella tayi]|nr:hypothetical protein BEI60_00075 [Eisenbergiella tayi]
MPAQGIQTPREGKLQAEKGEEKRAAEYTMHSSHPSLYFTRISAKIHAYKHKMPGNGRMEDL